MRRPKTKPTVAKKTTPIQSAHARTSQGLRDLLFDEIQDLRLGCGDPRRATAVANLAKQIMGTVKMEIEFSKEQRRADQAGTGGVDVGTLSLGSGPHAVDAVKSVMAR